MFMLFILSLASELIRDMKSILFKSSVYNSLLKLEKSLKIFCWLTVGTFEAEVQKQGRWSEISAKQTPVFIIFSGALV